MAFGNVQLIPGINVERTPTLNEAGYSQSSLIRFRDGLAEKIGGWVEFYPFAVSGVPRDLHAWQDLNTVKLLFVGSTTSLSVISAGSLEAVTPQQLISNCACNFTTLINTPTVTIVDPNITTVTTFDSVFFNTPISVGGLILSGLYSIVAIIGTHSYQITASSNATATVANGGAVPAFATVSGSAIVTVTLAAHGMSVDSIIVFQIPTTGNGVTISGAYPVTTVPGANSFTIVVASQANATSSFNMNSGNAQLLYYLTLGPPQTGVGYGLGGYGLGGYGTGAVNPVQQGTPITALDLTSDNWGEILLACPQGGSIYYWNPNGGFVNAQVISSGPPFNGGIFVSTSQQILVAWGSSIDQKTNFPLGIGVQQDPMLVAWSAVENFFDFGASALNQAGNFRIPIGSEIRGGMAVANQNLIWTDLDLWAMNYIGPPDVYGFNKIGAGAGLAGSHAALQLRGGVYWMGASNFYRYLGGSVTVIPCPVWDAVFQNLNTTYIKHVRAMPNTAFNEAGWLYPSAASTNGECDSYVKFNITEQGSPWDYGPMPRSAWIDQSVLGPPIGASPIGVIYQHESGYNASNQALLWSFTTGYFVIAQAEDFPFIDQIIPDMKWGIYSGPTTAQVSFIFSMINYPGDAPRTFGPYTITQSSQQISTRMRGRQMSITVQGNDLNSFARLGRVRYRWSAQGRR